MGGRRRRPPPECLAAGLCAAWAMQATCDQQQTLTLDGTSSAFHDTYWLRDGVVISGLRISINRSSLRVPWVDCRSAAEGKFSLLSPRPTCEVCEIRTPYVRRARRPRCWPTVLINSPSIRLSIVVHDLHRHHRLAVLDSRANRLECLRGRERGQQRPEGAGKGPAERVQPGKRVRTVLADNVRRGLTCLSFRAATHT